MTVEGGVAYPHYKKTGVAWLGALPENWNVAAISALSDKITNGYVGPTRNIFHDSGVRYLQSLHIKNNKIEFHTPYYVSDEWSREKEKSILKEGDVLVVQTGDIGQVAAVDKKFVDCNCHALIIISTSDKLNGFYLSWLLNSDYGFHSLKAIQTGALHPHLNCGSVKTIKVPVPTTGEQRKIANFLDHETTKIDTLIEKQQQLIKLLKEKRQAVISHAVTKGLNPDAPMKDSGVEWLGEVPEGWVIAQLKFNTLEMQTGPFGSQLHAEDYVEDGIPLVNPVHMINGTIKPDSQVSVDVDTSIRLERHQLSEGDLIFARRGELGRCAVVTSKEVGWICGTGSLRATLNSKLVPEYSYLLVSSRGVVSELSLESKGSTMENLNTTTLGRVKLPIPPVREQEQILEYVHTESGRYKGVIENAKVAINLMKERRTALISAAVTGKIDVRNWQPPKATSTPSTDA